jgi:hypothetical protein
VANTALVTPRTDSEEYETRHVCNNEMGQRSRCVFLYTDALAACGEMR